MDSGSAIPDFKISAFSTSVTEGRYITDIASDQVIPTFVTSNAVIDLLQSGDRIAIIKGSFKQNLAGTFSLRWAQNTSNATASQLKPGSYLILTKE